MVSPVGISMLGSGNVGGGVVAALNAASNRYERSVGRPLQLRQVLVRDLARQRDGLTASQLTTSFDDLISDEGTQIVVELMGGEEPAYEYIARALASGRDVVTANKEVMAKHGAKLLALAAEHEVRLLYEASVGGGIPIISPLSRDLLANEVSALTAIINGTTNFMLTAMADGGVDYKDVLAEAQRLGYAEPDPTADVEGFDASYKLAILCGLAFGLELFPEEIERQGISLLASQDFIYAAELGYTIKLLARARLDDGYLIASVCPTLIYHDEPLAKVDGVLNAVEIEGNLVGHVLFEGPGAGPTPTASAVLADVLALARDIVADRRPLAVTPLIPAQVLPSASHKSRFYIRLTVPDQAGVLAQIAGALGERGVSIASVLQFEADDLDDAAELVLTTYLAERGAVNDALKQIEEAQFVQRIGNLMPIAGLGGAR